MVSCSSRCKLDLENVLVTLEDQELKGKVELMKSLQEVILELQVSNAPSLRSPCVDAPQHTDWQGGD